MGALMWFAMALFAVGAIGFVMLGMMYAYMFLDSGYKEKNKR